MVMLVAFNGLQRTAENFRQILKEADERFVVDSITRPTGGLMGLICVSWESPDRGMTNGFHT